MALTLDTAPTDEPITLEEAKDHLRVDTTDDDALIGALITAVREHTEDFLGRALVTQTWDYDLDDFPANNGEIKLPKAPLQSVTSISYIDGDGASQTLDASKYIVDTPTEAPGRIALAYGESWPTTRGIINSVTVKFVAGYGDNSDDVPGTIRQAMLLMLSEMYERREDAITGTIISAIPFGAKSLLWPNRVLEL